MILTEHQIHNLPKETLADLLDLLYKIEDQLDYKCKRITNTIDYLQQNIK